MNTTWRQCTIGDVCDTISNTYNSNAQQVVLINTSDVLEGKVLNHIYIPNENLKGQFKKTFEEGDILYYIAKFVHKTNAMHTLISPQSIILHRPN